MKEIFCLAVLLFTFSCADVNPLDKSLVESSIHFSLADFSKSVVLPPKREKDLVVTASWSKEFLNKLTVFSITDFGFYNYDFAMRVWDQFFGEEVDKFAIKQVFDHRNLRNLISKNNKQARINPKAHYLEFLKVIKGFSEPDKSSELIKVQHTAPLIVICNESPLLTLLDSSEYLESINITQPSGRCYFKSSNIFGILPSSEKYVFKFNGYFERSKDDSNELHVNIENIFINHN